MKRESLLLALCIVTFVALVSCTNKDAAVDSELIGRWALDSVLYEDGTENKMEAGNFVEIHPDHIVEVIAEAGHRRYSFKSDGGTFRLEQGDETVVWEVIRREADTLKVATPIGVYVLKDRASLSERKDSSG